MQKFQEKQIGKILQYINSNCMLTEAKQQQTSSKQLLALSAGICDNCRVPRLINTGGDGVHEPAHKELYCEKKSIFIEPQLPVDQVTNCDSFEQQG